MKTLKNIQKKDNTLFCIPRSIQEIIPCTCLWEDGIMLLNDGNYAKTFFFDDINYAIASREDKETMFLQYSELLNSFDPGATTKITILNRRTNKIDFQKKFELKQLDDNLKSYREEYNTILSTKALNSNTIIQEKYITVSVNKKTIDEARTFFSRIESEMNVHLKKLDSYCNSIDAENKLRILNNFYRPEEDSAFFWNMKEDFKKGHSFKDNICPNSASFKNDYCELGNQFARCFFIKDYATYIKDSFITELTDSNRNMILSIDVIPIPMDEAIKEVENRRLGVETNITNWQRRQNNNNNFSAIIPYDLELQRKESKEFLEDLTIRDQRMFVCVITIVIAADTKEELDTQTDSLLSIGRKHLCQIAPLKYQQLDGLNTCLPFGCRNIDALRTLTTESLAAFMPFKVQEINHHDGIYYGENAISKNIIIANRKELLNGNSFILGVSGSGKSFAAKNEIVSIALRDKNADIIVIDPEREYGNLINALGGENIRISSTSKNHINAMDINSDYGNGENPVTLKSEFILSLCEQLMGEKLLGPKEKSIIDRCVAKVYRIYQQSNYKGVSPTLQDFHEELMKQPEKESKDIALAIELFTKGSLNTFAQNTNININNRIICYDILDLGKELLSIGMLVVLDSILNRITKNRNKKKNTYIFIDEIYLLFQNEYSANFLFTLWKRVRKYGALCTGITQNVDDLLQSHTARTMLANSEFLIILNQASTDRIELAKLLSISNTQLSHITNVDTGQGLLKIGHSLIPFKNNFPKDSSLYKLMTTKIEEK